jgi:hypothetical protein
MGLGFTLGIFIDEEKQRGARKKVESVELMPVCS